LPKPELLSFAIADPLSALANVADSSCLLICDRTQKISTDSIGDIATYNGQIERQTIASNSIPKYYNFVRSNDGLYTDLFTIILAVNFSLMP
jgi:hypothetical protein